MPRRPRRLEFIPPRDSQTNAPGRSSNLTVPVSPFSPRAPLTPPPRLHLRTVLPPAPLPPRFQGEVPPIPRSWIWKCHLCRNTYSFSVTRRCLRDGHYFCSVASSPTTGQPKGCQSRFDYIGWNQYNIWRREMKLHRRASITLTMRSGRGLLGRWNHEHSPSRAGPRTVIDVDGLNPLWEERDCWVDCNFPSECHTYRAQVLHEKRLRQKRAEDDAAMQRMVSEEVTRREQEEIPWRDIYLVETGSTSPSSVSSSTAEEPNEVDDDKQPLHTTSLSSPNISPCADRVKVASEDDDLKMIDCDGIGEIGYSLERTSKRRKQSIDALFLGNGEREPTSPLKEEMFWGPVNDEELGAGF